ncbi:MAG: carboxypeptidase-like regulatory domain-containing protein, partial [Cyclobacteriaceae bacterium]
MKSFSFLIIILFLSLVASAQELKVSGLVTDAEYGEGLPGATIQIKGKSIGTVTDMDGNYSLQVNDGDVLVFSFIGYDPQEIAVGKETIINVRLKPDVSALEEVVVIGYTAERKKDLTGAVSVVKMDEVKDLPAGNVMKNIQGRLAGVSVTTDGSPGSNATIRIRGTGSLNNNDPLYVIDGVPTKKGMHELNPNDI